MKQEYTKELDVKIDALYERQTKKELEDAARVQNIKNDLERIENLFLVESKELNETLTTEDELGLISVRRNSPDNIHSRLTRKRKVSETE